MQLRPGDKGFKIWIRALKQCFGVNMKTRQMTYKLGKWLPEIHSKYNQWSCHYDQISLQLFQLNGNDYDDYDSWTSSINRTGSE